MPFARSRRVRLPCPRRFQAHMPDQSDPHLWFHGSRQFLTAFLSVLPFHSRSGLRSFPKVLCRERFLIALRARRVDAGTIHGQSHPQFDSPVVVTNALHQLLQPLLSDRQQFDRPCLQHAGETLISCDGDIAEQRQRQSPGMIKRPHQRPLIRPDPQHRQNQNLSGAPLDIPMQLNVREHAIVDRPLQSLPEQLAISKLRRLRGFDDRCCRLYLP